MINLQTCVFSGGGVIGCAYSGAIEALEEKKQLSGIKYFVGSSAGALASMICSTGASLSYINELLINTDFNKFLENDGKTNFLNLNWSQIVSNYGHGRGTFFKSWCENILEKLGYNRNLTLGELYDQTGNHLVTTTTCLKTSSLLYLSRSSYPNLRVVDAVHSSILIPYLFQPNCLDDILCKKGKRILVDGGLIDNYPLNACDARYRDGRIWAYNTKVIGFFPHKGGYLIENSDVKNLLDYTYSVLSCLYNQLSIEKTKTPFFWERSVPIETYDVSSFNFNISQNEKNILVKSGYESTIRFLNENTFYKKYEDLFITSEIYYDGKNFNPLPIYDIDKALESTMIYNTNPNMYDLYKIPFLNKK